MSLKLNLDQVAGLAAELANNATFVAAMTAALANTNANVATVSGVLANTNADLSAVSDTLEFVASGYETVQNAAISNTGVVTFDLAGQNTIFRTVLSRNVSNVAIINAPPVTTPPTQKTFVWHVVGQGLANTVTFPALVLHNGGNTPTINTANGKVTTISMFTDDGGVKVRSFKAGET